MLTTLSKYIKVSSLLRNQKLAHVLNQVLYSLFTFSVTFFGARFMKIEDFGDFSYAYSFLPLLNIIPLAFVYFPMMNFYSKWKGKDSNYILSNAIINLILSLLLSVICFCLLYVTGTIIDEILIFVVFYLMYQSYEFIRRLFMVKEQMKILNQIEVFKLLSFLALVICLTYYYQWNINYLITILLLVMVLTNVIAYTKAKIVYVQKPELINTFHESYTFGKWILLSNFVQNLSSNFFIYLSGVLLTSEAIARLNAPKLFLGLATIFLLSMDNYYTPKIASKRLNDNISFLDSFKHIIKELRMFYLIIFICALIIIYYQDLIIYYVFGQQYTIGENYLWGFIVVGLIYALMRPFLILLRVYEKTKFIFKSSIWVLFLVLIITYPLIKFYGALGGLISMIAGNLLQIIIFVFYLKNYDKRVHRK